jgi:hypothetical protein
MPAAKMNVRLRGQSAKDMLALTSSQFDPTTATLTQLCWGRMQARTFSKGPKVISGV